MQVTQTPGLLGEDVVDRSRQRVRESGDEPEPLVEDEDGVRVADDEAVAVHRHALGAARTAARVRVDRAPGALGYRLRVERRAAVEVDDAHVAGEALVARMADGRRDDDPRHAGFRAKTWKKGPTARSAACTAAMRRARL